MCSVDNDGLFFVCLLSFKRFRTNNNSVGCSTYLAFKMVFRMLNLLFTNRRKLTWSRKRYLSLRLLKSDTLSPKRPAKQNADKLKIIYFTEPQNESVMRFLLILAHWALYLKRCKLYTVSCRWKWVIFSGVEFLMLTRGSRVVLSSQLTELCLS